MCDTINRHLLTSSSSFNHIDQSARRVRSGNHHALITIHGTLHGVNVQAGRMIQNCPSDGSRHCLGMEFPAIEPVVQSSKDYNADYFASERRQKDLLSSNNTDDCPNIIWLHLPVMQPKRLSEVDWHQPVQLRTSQLPLYPFLHALGQYPAALGLRRKPYEPHPRTRTHVHPRC